MRLTRLATLFLALLVTPALAADGQGGEQRTSDTGASAPVMGGSAVPEGKWRDTAAVLFGGEQGCTGVLVAPTVVMTAAHCIDNTLNAVLIGTNSLARPGLGETIMVSRRLSYPQYKYDVAIVILAQPSTVTPRRLATGWAQSDVVNGARVQFVGYGAVDRNARTYVDEMQEAESTVTDFNCTTHAGCDTGARPNGEIGAGGAGIDTCPGDSGGPMYLLTPYGEFLAGITSRGYDNNQYDCSEGGIYTRPDKAEIVSWVETQAQVYLPDGRGPIADKLFVQPGGESSLTVDPNDVQSGRSYTWEIVTPPAHGTATIDASGKLTVVAAADYLGPDAVVVRATDTTDTTRSARGRIEVEVVEELPDGEDGGCCRATHGPTGPAAPALLVVIGLMFRRRRRTLAA